MNLKEVRRLIENREIDLAIKQLEQANFFNFNKNAMNNYLYCCLIKGDNRGLGKLQAASKRINTDNILPHNFADSVYLSAMSFFLPMSVKRQVADLNLSTNGILDNPALYDLERRLVEDEQILSDYIQSRFEAYVDRHESEYKYIARFGLEFFPYKYICDYRGRRPKAVDGVRRLSFIYCIKSRSARTRISLTSLTRAYENYLASSPRAAFIEVELLLVEDISGDLLPRFPLLGANRFISHYLVDTKVEWTRSGLLNYGLKRATGDAIAFCDVDFLFHRDFFFALEKTTARVDFDKDVLVVNCFETEGHVRDLAYSRLSPYGYMWVVGRRNATSIGGFNEEYKGHGFEDRDFEYRLVNSLGLAVVNSHCLDPSLAVLHFSHNVRTGLQERGANQNKFINIGKTASPVQHRWGEQRLVKHVCYDTLLAANFVLPERRSSLDLLIMPHNRYHAWTIDLIKEDLWRRAVNFAVVSPLPYYRDEGVEDYCKTHGLPCLRLGDVTRLELSFAGLAVFNDWDKKLANPLVSLANREGLTTIGIVEGINDYLDVDTGRTRNAYRTVRHVLLPGAYDLDEYFPDMEGRAFVVGVPRLDRLAAGSKHWAQSSSRRVLINCNFTYGVLDEWRDRWLRDIVAVCAEVGCDYEISRHPADQGDFSGFHISPDTFYMALGRCGVLVSRFSSCILEALITAKPAVYYNPGFEKARKFQEPMGAYLAPTDKKQLASALREVLDGRRFPTFDFLERHCSVSATSGQRAAAAIRSALNGGRPPVGASPAMLDGIRRICAQAEHSH